MKEHKWTSGKFNYRVSDEHSGPRAFVALRDGSWTTSSNTYALSAEILRLEEERATWQARAEAGVRYAAELKEEKAPCTWTEDEDGNYETGCGETFEFIYDGPKENHIRFCCYCGGALEAKQYSPPAEET